LRRWKGNRLESQNTGTELLSFGITAVGSVIASAFAVWLIIFKGQTGDGAGIVLIPILFPCLAAPIPGLIGQLIFAKYTNSLISAVMGILFASITLVVIYSSLIGTAMYKEKKLVKSAEKEMVFFKSALEGKFKDDVIRDHYKEFNLFSKYEREAIEKLLYAKNRDKFSSQAISVLIDLVTNDILIVGYLADQPETTVEVKMKIAESQDEYAVLPMAKNPLTPPEVLRKLAKHKIAYVSQLASSQLSSNTRKSP
jgi:hypothetical protein